MSTRLRQTLVDIRKITITLDDAMKVRSAALSRKNYRDLDLNSCIGQVLKIKGKWRRTATLRLCNESDEDIPDNVYFVWYNGSKKQVSSMYVVPDCGDPVHVLSLAWY